MAGLSRLPIEGVTAFLDAHRGEFGLRYGVIGAAVGSLSCSRGAIAVLINYPRAPEKLRITTTGNLEDRRLRDD